MARQNLYASRFLVSDSEINCLTHRFFTGYLMVSVILSQLFHLAANFLDELNCQT